MGSAGFLSEKHKSTDMQAKIDFEVLTHQDAR